jgi:NTE family protein
MDFFRRNVVDRPIEALDLRFGAVATALHTGAEVWLREGSTVDAVRASIALPVLFTPVRRDGVTLVDGGLVNPVPVSLARAMGADVVIAVDLNTDLLGRHLRPAAAPDAADGGGLLDEWRRRLGNGLNGLGMPALARANAPAEPPLPSLLDVLATSLNIMQVRITRSRMAGDPADATIAPRLGALGLLDFHRAAEAIEAGRHATALALPALREVLQP